MITGVHQTPIGRVRLTAGAGALVSAALTEEPVTLLPAGIIAQAAAELEDYFAGRRQVFTVPLAPVGTAFQQRVWQALCTIPFGQTVSYGEVARRAGVPSAVRAAGTAIGRNPLLIFIPCHRVIRGDGSIGGFAEGTAVKRRILAVEDVIL